MRVLFLTLYPDTAASPRYRVHQFLPYLQAHGVDCTVRSAVSPRTYAQHLGPNRRGRAAWYHLAETPRRLTQILNSRQYDVVFVQKALMSASVRGVAGLLRASARRVVYDIDDAVFLSPPHSLRAPWSLFEDHKQIDKVIRHADIVLAGNAWLAERVSELGGRPTLWPTVVDTDRFRPGKTTDSAFRIGWIGGPSTTPALRELGDALARIPNAEIRLVGADPARVPFNADIHPWRYGTEVDAIRHFSVGIMPLPKSDWSRGKCALKALQYMACGVPCVATPFGAVLDVIRHNDNGLFADTPEQWREAVEQLRDPALRRRLGEAGRQTVFDRYALNNAAPRLCDLLTSTARERTTTKSHFEGGFRGMLSKERDPS